MSIQDNKLVYCDDFDLSTISASSNSNVTNILDLGGDLEDAFGSSITNDIGQGGEVFLNILCTEDFASAGSPTVTFDLHASAAEGMTSPDTVITFTKDKTPNSGEVIFSGGIPAGTFKRYSTINVATTDALTAGKIVAFLSDYPVEER